MRPKATRSAQPFVVLARLTPHALSRGALPLALGALASLAGCTQSDDNGTASSRLGASTSIWGTTAPAGSADSDSQAVELGVRFRSDVAGVIAGIRYYKSSTNTGTHTGHLWSNTGTLLGSVTFTSEGTSGWQTAAFATPIAIAANTTYVASYHTDTGHYFGTNSAFASAGVDNPPLHALEDGADGANGVYHYGATAFPSNTYRSSNYWVDVVFQANDVDAGATDSGTDAGVSDSARDTSVSDSATDAGVTDGGTCAPSCSGRVCGSDGCGGSCGACGSGLSCNASGQCVSGGTITHGEQLTLADVGPAGLGITTFTSVPGGTFTGTPLSGWGSLARVVGAGGETIDGFTFPQGTVVLQGASLTSQVVVNSGWLVLRGCQGSMLLNHPSGDGGGGAALYSQLTAFNATGLKDGRQPAVSICHRCYFPDSGLENVYANNVTVTESWVAVDPGNPGDHVDGIQTWGGQSYLNFSRNHLQWNATANSTQSSLISMYADGPQNGSTGYDHVTVQNNYFVIGAGGGIGLHAPMGVPVTNMVVSGNRWAWYSGFGNPNYTPAVYRGTTFANYKVDGNGWSDNRWDDGPYASQFLRPDDSTGTTDY